jgi:hypothetical protein
MRSGLTERRSACRRCTTSRTTVGGGGTARRASAWRLSRSCAGWSMDAPLLTDDFKEFLRLLNANHVEYLLVGGYAVGLHGYPRATVDMDIWVRPTPPNAARVMTVLRAFGFDLPTLQPRLFTDPGSIVRFGTPPRALLSARTVRISAWTAPGGVGHVRSASRVGRGIRPPAGSARRHLRTRLRESADMGRRLGQLDSTDMLRVNRAVMVFLSLAG